MNLCKYTLLLLILTAATSLSGQLVIDLNHDFGGEGGAIEVKKENGITYAAIQPDITGDGAFFRLASLGDASAFRFEGHPTGMTHGIFRLAGFSTNIFDLNEMGDDGVRLTNEAINSNERNNEPGLVSSAANTTTNVTNTLVVLRSVTITAPTDGYVVVHANCQYEINHTNGTSSYANIGINDVSTSLSSVQDVAVGVSPGASSALYAYRGAALASFEVTAGVHTFYYMAQRTAGSGTHSAKDKKIIATFFPTTYGSHASDAQGDPSDDSLVADSGMTEADIKAERDQSIAANQARIQAELAKLQAEVAAMNAAMGSNSPE